MPVTRARDSQSQGSDTESRYLIDFDLFDRLMNAKGIPGPTARARKVGLPRSTYYRVINHEVRATLATANQFARAAGTSVQKLFPLATAPTTPPTTPPSNPGPNTPPPPSGPKRGES